MSADGESKAGGQRRPSLWAAASVFCLFAAVGAAGLYYDRAAQAPVKRAVPGKPTLAGDEGHQGPRRHPNIELPADVVSFLDQLGKSAEASPEDIGLWQKLARARYRAGLLNRAHMAGARLAVDHLLELDPDNMEALRTKANIIYDSGRYAEAEAAFHRYLEVDPGDAAVTTDLASALLFQGRRPEAVAAYKAAIAADPDFFQAHFNLAIALHAGGQSGEALASFDRARQLAKGPEQLQRIDAAMAAAEAGTAAEAGAKPTSNAFSNFHRDVESLLTGHPIAGPKITGFDWRSPSQAKVAMRGFPMQAMPAVVRNKFKSKLNASIAALANRHGVSDRVSIELVDAADGKTMDKLDAEEFIGAFDPQP